MRRLALLVAAVFLFGTVSQAGAAQLLNMGTGPTGGTYYPVGAAMAKVWSDNIKDLKVTAQSTGGTLNNIQLLGDGDAEACWADGAFYDAYNGTGPFKDKPQKFLRAIVAAYPEVYHMMVATDSGIKTLNDIKGKRISVGQMGGSVKPTTDLMLRAAGMDPDKDIKPEYLGHADSVAAFSDKRIDGHVSVGALGIASVVETTTLGVAHLIPLPDKVVAEVCKAAPYFAAYTIPANTYKGQTAAVPTFSSPNIIAVHEKLPDELVYQMTKQLFANKESLIAVSAKMSEMTPEAITSIQIPVHPGAVKYYREIGIMK